MKCMTNTLPSPIGHACSEAGPRHHQHRTPSTLFAGAVAIAALSLFGGASAAAATAWAAPSTSGGHVIFVDDNGNSVNDQGQTSGDIFTQNAQDQSTA
jgi:hypothetical protein